MKKQSYFSIFIGFVIFFVIPVDKSHSQICHAEIDPNLPPVTSCTPKPGYNLIFEDYFNSFNASVWDKSSPGDDRCEGYQNPNFCTCSNHTPFNESNVLGPSGGVLDLRVREGEDMNACDYSGAEIKTFNNIKDLNPSYRSWKVNANNYVEARVKIPDCKGVGAAFWLRGASLAPDRFFEIDVFEFDHNDPTIVKANVHFAPLGQGCSACVDPEESYICDLDGNSVNLTDQYLVFGVDITNQFAKLYINDVFYRAYNFSSSPYNRPLPFDIRLSGSDNAHDQGTNPSDCDNLPQLFKIDYVRVFQKADTKVIKFSKYPAEMALCANNQCLVDYCNFIKVNYFPGVTYQWDAHPNFEIINASYNSGDVETFRVDVVQGTPPGEYQLKLTATFPCGGYQEELFLKVKVMSGNPPTPTGIFLVTDDNNFFYPATNIANNTTSYEWSLGGVIWTDVPNPAVGNKNIHEKFFKAGSIPRQVTVCVRAKNACGVSPSICRTLVIPAKDMGCQGCLNLLLPPREIVVEQINNSENYQLRVLKSPYSESYEWSFDQEQWDNVDNSNGALFNYFGSIEPGLDSFLVFVRAKNNDTISTVYSQKVATPGVEPQEKQGGIKEYSVASSNNDSQADERGSDSEQSVSSDVDKFYVVYNTIGQLVYRGVTTIEYLKQDLSTGIYIIVQKGDDLKLKGVSKLVVTR